jgi:hypothetical protein
MLMPFLSNSLPSAPSIPEARQEQHDRATGGEQNQEG